MCFSFHLCRHSCFNPAAKPGNLLLRPFSIAWHTAIFQPLKDVLSMCTDVLIVPEVEGELHGISIVLTEQGLDILRETGYAILGCHDTLLHSQRIQSGTSSNLCRAKCNTELAQPFTVGNGGAVGAQMRFGLQVEGQQFGALRLH